MTSLVLDTHSCVWFLANSPRLSTIARQATRDAIASSHPVYVSAVSIVEILYLTEKRRFTQDVLNDLIDVLRRPDSGIQVAPLNLEIAVCVEQIPRDKVPDMPDRIIGATAIHLGFPLVTADAQLQASGVATIW